MSVQRYSVFEELRQVDALVDQRIEPAMVEERLPFTVRVVRNEDDLRKAVDIRRSAYARHMPVLAEALSAPEDDDTDDGAAVLLAESKLDGSPLGSVRIQTNRFGPANIEQSVDLPSWLANRSIADIRRLGIEQGRSSRLVRMVLFKACFEFSKVHDVAWMVLAAKPPLDKIYQQILFDDVFPEAGLVPLRRAQNVLHRVMAFNVRTGQDRWTAAKHPLLDFFCHTYHPDIDVGAAPARPALPQLARGGSYPGQQPKLSAFSN